MSEALLIGGYRTLRPHHLDGRQCADLHLLLRIGEGLLGKRERLFLHPYIFVGVHQVPVHVFDLVDGGDNLQAEGNVGNFAVVFGDVNEARIGRKAKPLQQMLGHSSLEVGVELAG